MSLARVLSIIALAALFQTSFLVVPCTGQRVQRRGTNSKLYRSLIGRSEAVRTRALTPFHVNPGSTRDSLDDLIAAAKKNAEETEPDEIVRPSTLRLIYLIGTVDDPASEGLLVELLDSPHTGISMVSADSLGKNKFYGAIDYLKKQIDRPEYDEMYGFRFNLVRAFAQMEHPDAVDFLCQLRRTLDGQLRFQIENVLKDVTVAHFQGDDQRFAEFEKQERGEQIFKPAAFDPASLNRMKLERQQYYGIDIHARRLMFIIDRSGSMKDYWGGMSRLERAKGELIRAIRELPEDSEFAIIFYDTAVKEWREDLVYASEENKLEAIQFVRRLGYGDRTNTYGALRRSLEFDDDLEAVFLLTDGRPTAGNIVAPSGIVNDILHRNRFRHLNFNTIGIAVEGPTESFLRRLAEESNGEYRKAL